MLRLLLLFSGIIFLQSCVSLKRCNEKFPPIVGIKDTTIYKDTVIYKDIFKYQSGDSVTLHDRLLKNVFLYPKDTVSEYKTNGVKAVISNKNSKWSVACMTDSLLVEIKNYELKIKNKEREIRELRLQKVVVEKAYYKIIWFWMFVGIVLIIVLKAFKK